MKGYFHKIASRATGTPAKTGLNPAKPQAWQQLSSPLESAATPIGHSEMSDWPDTFDGLPATLESTHSLPRGERKPALPITPAQDISKPLPQVQLTPPPVTPPPALSSETHSQANQEEQVQRESPKTSLNPPTDHDAHSSKSLEQPKVNLPRSLRKTPQVLKWEDGPIPPPVPRGKSVQLAPSSVTPPEAKVGEEQQSASQQSQQLRPEAQQLQPLQQALSQDIPLRQKEVSKPLPTKEETLTPQLQPVRQQAPPSAPPPPSPKTALTIGKIIVEVVEPVKPPATTVQPPPVRQRQPVRQSASLPPSNNLKYGLGQI